MASAGGGSSGAEGVTSNAADPPGVRQDRPPGVAACRAAALVSTGRVLRTSYPAAVTAPRPTTAATRTAAMPGGTEARIHRDLQPWQRALPNVLTGARIVLAIVFVALLSTGADPLVLGPPGTDRASEGGPVDPPTLGISWTLVAAGLVFIVAAATDAADGFLARRWRCISVIGRILDPFADKLLTMAAFVFLASAALTARVAGLPADDPSAAVHLGGFLPWMVVVILARELLVTTIRGLYESRGVDFSAIGPGKIKMIVQSIAIPLILLLVGTGRATGTWGLLIDGIAWLTTGVTAWSALGYIGMAVRARRSVAETMEQPAEASRDP